MDRLSVWEILLIVGVVLVTWNALTGEILPAFWRGLAN